MINEISIVIPALNEEESIPSLISEIDNELSNTQLKYEIIIVDDGSKVSLDAIVPKNKNLKKEKILIIGYGGAALAIHYVLRKKGFKNITIVNRTKKKLKFENETKYTKSISDLGKHLNTAQIIINTTPKNLISSKNKKLVNPKALLSDIVYKPKETNFLKMFPKNKKIYGISMLLEQAIPCFKIWFGFNPSVDQKLIKVLNNKIK